MSGRLCRAVIALFGLLYLVALALFAIGTFGLFDAEADPLAGVFILPLGLPWTLVTGNLPDGIRPWAAIASPLLNLSIMIWLCRRGHGNWRAGRR